MKTGHDYSRLAVVWELTPQNAIHLSGALVLAESTLMCVGFGSLARGSSTGPGYLVEVTK